MRYMSTVDLHSNILKAAIKTEKKKQKLRREEPEEWYNYFDIN